jgi:hypothetical protein
MLTFLLTFGWLVGRNGGGLAKSNTSTRSAKNTLDQPESLLRKSRFSLAAFRCAEQSHFALFAAFQSPPRRLVHLPLCAKKPLLHCSPEGGISPSQSRCPITRQSTGLFGFAVAAQRLLAKTSRKVVDSCPLRISFCPSAAVAFWRDLRLQQVDCCI